MGPVILCVETAVADDAVQKSETRQKKEKKKKKGSRKLDDGNQDC